MRSFLAFAFFSAFLFAGYKLAVESWGGQVWVYTGEYRAPASVRKIGDYAPIDRKSLFTSPQKQLLSPAQTSSMPGFVGVNLGHPLLKTDNGVEFACRVQGHYGLFDRMEVTFMGVGVADSGEPPKVVVQTECLVGDRLDRLAPIWVPVKDLSQAESWVLWNVKLYREENPQDSLNLGSAELREANPKLFSFGLERFR